MQQYYENLYNDIHIEDINKVADIYKFMDYKAKIKELEFNQYQATYGHVVHKYEKMRNTKIWRLAKKIKAKLRGI